MGGWNKGQGKTLAWLVSHVDYCGDDCLIWPFYRLKNGYALFGAMGGMHYAHRYMCELVNGPPPLDYEAAHSCGNGHLGCVHPCHLSWKTKSGNHLDSSSHGTSYRNKYGNKGALTSEQVRTIRELKGKETQDKLAEMFGVSAPTIRAIYSGRTYKNVPL